MRPFAVLLPLLLASVAAAVAVSPVAAQRGPGSDSSDLGALSDEFADASTLSRWRWFHEAEGWPDHVRRADVGRTRAGQLYVEPHTSGWYAEFHGPFLFKMVEGDFDVRARVRAGPALEEGVLPDSALPGQVWSLAGVMVREPRRVTSANWEPRGENWLFLTTGIAEPLGRPVLESKTTVNGRSALKLRPGRAGWVELRVVRLGPTFLLLYRYDDGAWVLHERFYRPDLPPALQVGLNAYTDWNTAQRAGLTTPQAFNTTVMVDGKPDLGLLVDWVRFRRPTRPRGVPLDRLADYDFPAAELLRVVGG